MKYVLSFITWFFSNPAATIAFFSAIIALLAYRHQRKGMRKQNACQAAEKYAREILPRMRYIIKLLEFSGLHAINNKFTGFALFTEKELNDLLLKADCTEENYRASVNKIKQEHLIEALAFSGANEYLYKQHSILLEISQTSDKLGEAVTRFIKDFLNDMEAMATLLRYNIADEKLIYQSLHQTFLKFMKHWYFYISDENRKDQDRFYSNTIWLYNHWNKRKCYDEMTIDRVLVMTTKAKRL